MGFFSLDYLFFDIKKIGYVKNSRLYRYPANHFDIFIFCLKKDYLEKATHYEILNSLR